jgi:hypothetical protein
MGLDRGLLMQMARKGCDVICEKADECTTLPRHAPGCPHLRIHEKTPMCGSGRCSVGHYVVCIPPTDGQRVMQKLLDMQEEPKLKPIIPSIDYK